jgi:hypothetical protein
MPAMNNRIQVFVGMMMALVLFFRFLVYVDSKEPIRVKTDASMIAPFYGN